MFHGFRVGDKAILSDYKKKPLIVLISNRTASGKVKIEGQKGFFKRRYPSAPIYDGCLKLSHYSDGKCWVYRNSLYQFSQERLAVLEENYQEYLAQKNSEKKPCEKCGKVHKRRPVCSVCCKKPYKHSLNYPGALCNKCWTHKRVEEQIQKRRNSRPNLVEVDGYAYYTDLTELKLGDRVVIPPSWVDKLNGRYEPKEGTITSLYSDYAGQVNRIIGKSTSPSSSA